MYIEMFWTFRQSYKMLLFHIKIKSHIGNPVKVRDKQNIFFINIHILTRYILMHKIKILKLTVTVTNKIEQYYIHVHVYKLTNIRSNIILQHTCTRSEMVSFELFLQWSRE